MHVYHRYHPNFMITFRQSILMFGFHSPVLLLLGYLEQRDIFNAIRHSTALLLADDLKSYGQEQQQMQHLCWSLIWNYSCLSVVDSVAGFPEISHCQMQLFRSFNQKTNIPGYQMLSPNHNRRILFLHVKVERRLLIAPTELGRIVVLLSLCAANQRSWTDESFRPGMVELLIFTGFPLVLAAWVKFWSFVRLLYDVSYQSCVLLISSRFR